jgi:hypothetical protein
MNVHDRKTQVHRTSKQWHRLINEFDPSLHTVHKYCQHTKIATSSFYKWQTKLGLFETIENNNDVPTFIPIQTIPKEKPNSTE